MMRIVITPEAKKDFAGIKRYIKEELHNPSAAETIIDKAVTRIRKLVSYPQTGRALEGLEGYSIEYRYLSCDSYKIIYRIDKDKIIIVNMIHSKRDYSRLFLE